MSAIIEAHTLTFLKNLSKNNNKEWFEKNKDVYLKARGNMEEWAGDLLIMMGKHDNIETPSAKKSLMRIYRDIRFSKDKTPYKNHMGGGFKRATAALRGGYYYHIEPGAAFVGGGFWAPEKDDLARIREDIAMDDKPLRKIVAAKKFKDNFGILKGDELKTAPKGYEKDHPAIDLLRKKQFLIGREFSDKEMRSPDFIKEVNSTFKAMRPFFDYMSEVLTTNSNGESII